MTEDSTSVGKHESTMVIGPADPFWSSTFIRRSARWRHAIGIALLAMALFVRLSSLGDVPLWVDEAESSINALTILQHGVPMGTYLQMPIYENTQIVPWSDSREYRFKDVSYSDRGLAVYHGWIPLYAIAASLWTAGVQPDELSTTPHVLQTLKQKRLRTIVPRIPGVIFGLAAIAIFYFAGKALYGVEAGLAAAIITAFSPMHIYVSQQARYFSATVTLSALCGYATWQLVRRRRWYDFVLAGLAFGLLFHTHILTFLVACTLLALAIFTIALRTSHFPWRRLLVTACILVAIVLPWVLATGFLRTASTIPSAWRLMSLPKDLILYKLLASPAVAAAFCVFLLISIGLAWFRPDALSRLRLELTSQIESFIFLAVWLFVAYIAFIFLIPAASYAITRLGIMMLAPVTFLLAYLCAVVARSASPHHSAGITVAIACIVVGASLYFWPTPTGSAMAMQHNDIETAVSYIAGIPMQPSTRLYANPNDHLLLTYYSGVPVQSIASVRETFLNEHKGPIVLFLKNDFFVRPGDPIEPARLRQAAQRSGVSLLLDDATNLSRELASYEHRRTLTGHFAVVKPPAQKPPQFAMPEYTEWLKLRQQRDQEYAARWVNFPIFRGFQIRSVFDWWTVFFFRFSNPRAELLRPNFQARMRGGSAAALLGSNWTVYHSRDTFQQTSVACCR